MKSIGKAFPDCTRCRLPRNAGSRVAWGCDKPTSEATSRWEIGCSRCNGQDPTCEKCDGVGEIWQPRCPTSTVESYPRPMAIQALTALRAYGYFDRHGVLPVEGGLYAQSARFVDFCDVVGSERSRYDKIVQDEQAKQHG